MLLLAACAAAPQTTSDYVPRAVSEVQRWELLEDGQCVGWLLLMQIDDPEAGPLRFYRIENQRGQWLGHATLQGRFSRRVPFRDDEEDLGLFGMAQGTGRLLDTKTPPTIANWQQPQTLEAAAHKEPR